MVQVCLIHVGLEMLLLHLSDFKLYKAYVLSQVETVAQFGVVFLLFALGLEFSLTKVHLLRTFISLLNEHVKFSLYVLKIRFIHNFLVQLKVVGAVAVFGGFLQIIIFMFLCGIIAMVIYKSLHFFSGSVRLNAR